jgi:hypothetical protein
VTKYWSQSFRTPGECEGKIWHWDIAYSINRIISKADACLDQDLWAEGQNIFVTNVMNLYVWSAFLIVGKVGKPRNKVIVCVVTKSNLTKNI